ncbi:MAG: YdcF family protein [Kiritimatiellae bacterium]|nr:YdcF family protein [Kiritimatiellia bacterium]
MSVVSFRERLARMGRVTVRLCAILFILQFVVGFLGLPRSLTDWLSCRDAEILELPRYMVVLGGSGIPSKTGLMRTYYAARFGREHTNMTCIVALPSNGDSNEDSASRMRDELVLRGIPEASVLMESEGLNTYEQAVNIARMLGEEAFGKPLVVVTSPWHTRRSLMCFQKQGFTQVSTIAAHNTGVEADMGKNLALRYAIWSNLSAQADVARELTALLVYRLRGWI